MSTMSTRRGDSVSLCTSCSYESSKRSSSPSTHWRSMPPTVIVQSPSGTTSARCARSRAFVGPQCAASRVCGRSNEK